MVDRIGQQLGNYQLLSLLGKGGFAEVYLGEHVYLKSKAALKILYAQLATEDKEHFLTEARLLVGLTHPNIVRVLEFGVEGDTPFLVMDYAPNGSLRQRHPRGTSLPLSTVVSYTKQIADALQYAHQEKLVHRDVKPENMLVGRRNEVLLSDFGIAVMTQSSRQERTQDIVGTIAYMAPEQITAHPRPASDQYSLGIVVYEWLSGDRPFQGSFTEIAIKHSLVRPPSLREKMPTFSPIVEQVVQTALAKDPKDRFASVQAFANALEQASLSIASPLIPTGMGQTALSTQPSRTGDVLGLPSQQTVPLSQKQELSTPTSLSDTPSVQFSLPAAGAIVPNTSPPVGAVSSLPMQSPMTQPSFQQSPRNIPRRAIIPGLVGLALVAATGAGIAMFTQSRKLQQASAPTPPTGAHSTATTVSQTPTADTKPTATATPTRSATATPRPTQPPGTPVPGTTLFTYHGHSNRVNGVAWSPNGLRIVSGSDDYTVQGWDASNGGNVLNYRASSGLGLVEAVAWSPDGLHIAAAGGPDVWNAATGSHVYTYKGYTLIVYAVAWSPNSLRLASASADGTVQVWDATTGGHAFTYHGHSNGVNGVAWSPNGLRLASASTDGTVQVWDATTGSHVLIYRGHSDGVKGVAWSPNGQYIASAGADVQVWNATTGNRIYRYSGHFSGVNAVAWSSKSLRVASAGYDGTVQVWDALTGGHVLVYHGHSGGVNGVAWSPDGSRIASGSDDHTVQVWQAG